MTKPLEGCLDNAGLGAISRGLKHEEVKAWALQHPEDTGML